MGKLYIAYGSNTNKDSMKYRCPDAVFAGTGILRGYSLNFRGMENNSYASIEKNENSALEVALWKVSEADEQRLDYYESYPDLYRKETLKVELGNSVLDGLAYIMNENYDIALPSENYFNEIVEGYAQCGIDTEILFRIMFDIRDKITKSVDL